MGGDLPCHHVLWGCVEIAVVMAGRKHVDSGEDGGAGQGHASATPAPHLSTLPPESLTSEERESMFWFVDAEMCAEIDKSSCSTLNCDIEDYGLRAWHDEVYRSGCPTQISHSVCR